MPPGSAWADHVMLHDLHVIPGQRKRIEAWGRSWVSATDL